MFQRALLRTATAAVVGIVGRQLTFLSCYTFQNFRFAARVVRNFEFINKDISWRCLWHAIALSENSFRVECRACSPTREIGTFAPVIEGSCGRGKFRAVQHFTLRNHIGIAFACVFYCTLGEIFALLVAPTTSSYYKSEKLRNQIVLRKSIWNFLLMALGLVNLIYKWNPCRSFHLRIFPLKFIYATHSRYPGHRILAHPRDPWRYHANWDTPWNFNWRHSKERRTGSGSSLMCKRNWVIELWGRRK